MTCTVWAAGAGAPMHPVEIQRGGRDRDAICGDATTSVTGTSSGLPVAPAEVMVTLPV